MPTFHATIAPSVRRVYTLDWSDDLDTGETIASATWSAPSPLTIHDESLTDTTTTVAISGAVEGQQYIATCEIATNLGSPTYTDKRSLLLTCVGR